MTWQPWWFLWSLVLSWFEWEQWGRRRPWRKGNVHWAGRAGSHQRTTRQWLQDRGQHTVDQLKEMYVTGRRTSVALLTCSLVGALCEDLWCSESWSSCPGSHLWLSSFIKRKLEELEGHRWKKEKNKCVCAQRCTWKGRHCTHGQSCSSYRWGRAVRSSEVSDCCSAGTGTTGGPCWLRSTSGWLGPPSCSV